MLSGCGSTKVVYPSNSDPLSNISVEKADPDWLQEPQKPQKPTEEQLKAGLTNAELLEQINYNNQVIWQKDRDIRRAWTAYYKRLLKEGVIK